MTNVYVFDAAIAQQVRGRSSVDPNAALDPVALTDGRFYLSEAVVNDPAHAPHHATLAACELVDFATLADLLPPAEE